MSTECCKNEPSKDCCKTACCGADLANIYGAGLLRIWLGVRAIQTGVEKYSGVKLTDQAVKLDGVANEQGLAAAASAKEYGMVYYHGVPKGLYDKFATEPMMPKFMLPIYDQVLGPALLVLGLTVLLGIATRTSLFLLGLLYVSLTWGLILIKQDDGVSWLGIHMILIVMALRLADYNRFTILKKW